MPVSKDDILRSIRESPVFEFFKQEGITAEYLAKKIKRELNAKETKVFKAKSQKLVETDRLVDPKNPEAGKIYQPVETEEVIYSKPLVAWEVRQEARKDAHKLLGHYPNAKLTIEGSLSLRNLSDEELDERINATLKRAEGTKSKPKRAMKK
jgi:hypothetical protein